MSKATVKKTQSPKEPPAVNHNALIHEVEEAIKQQELERFWKEYGSWIIGGIIVAILLTAAVSGWRSYAHRANTSQTAVLMAAMESNGDDFAAALGEAAPRL